jgi:hypothetical protein
MLDAMMIPLLSLGKTITSSLFQDPAVANDSASVSETGGPPVISIFFNRPCAKNPMKRLSGDQN